MHISLIIFVRARLVFVQFPIFLFVFVRLVVSCFCPNFCCVFLFDDDWFETVFVVLVLLVAVLLYSLVCTWLICILACVFLRVYDLFECFDSDLNISIFGVFCCDADSDSVATILLFCRRFSVYLSDSGAWRLFDVLFV